MKHLFTHLIFIFLFCFSSAAQNNVTFQLDMNSVDPTTFTTPEVNGTFNSWCGSCASMTDIDGDNVWDIVIDLANGTYEFKFSADGWGIQETLFSGESCTNGNSQFTNRMLTVAGDTTLPVVCWGSCSSCSSGPPAYNVTFEVDMRGVTDPYNNPEVNGDFNSWCGNCWQMSDSDGDSIWDFSALFAAGDTIEWKYSADNWSIQEDLDSNLSCITINYDPSAPNGYGFVNRLSVISSDTTFSSPWNQCYVSSSVNGCTDPLAANYSSLATVDDGSCLFSTTFNVDMNCDTISFSFVHLESPDFGWCGGCVPMSDPDGDGVHSVTVNIPLGSFEYKYAVDNFSSDENLIDDMLNGGACAPITDYSTYANRLLSILPGTITNDTYGTCLNCILGCTDSLACNFDSLATFNDGSCLNLYGCMDPIAINYDSLANCPDSCIFSTIPTLTSLISACGDFDAGPAAWPYVLVATTVADGVSSQGAQTFTINVIDTAGGASVRVFKTTANGNSYFGPAIALTLGSNSITVPAVTFDRAVKFQFSSGDVEFDALSLNGISSGCVTTTPPNYTSLISACSDFDAGPTAWPYVLIATTIADGASSQGTQTFDMNITDTAGGASVRVFKTTANGNSYFGPALALTLGSNSITVPAVTFDRAVKFQFSSGDIEFDALSLNGVASACVAITGCTDSTALNYNQLATLDDSSCVYCYYGCMDVLACNYDSLATCDDGSCLTNFGCTDSIACNFNPLANCDDGSCLTIFGCTDSLANNYDPLATCGDSTCLYGYSVTFQLDLRGVTNINYIIPEINGVFNGWCGNCTQLEDLDNDSIWETTILLDSGSYEYKYSADNWSIQENLFSGDSSCTVSSNGFTNRILHVNQDTILDPVCWESCEDCLSSSGPSSYSVTFRLDMSEYVGPPFTSPEVNGTFNNWCGSCWVMTDDNGDNIWEFTALLAAGDTVEYKFSADSWNIQEEIDSAGNCVTVGFDPGAPNGWGYVNRYLVVDSEIELDAVCWNSCAECQGQTGLIENNLNNVFIYPNPSSGLININTPKETSRIDVYSVLGKLVYSKTKKTNTKKHAINIKESGIYYISVYVGNEVVSKKITIQK